MLLTFFPPFSIGIELIPFLATFFCCLLINIEYGILIGALIHLLMLVHEATATKSNYTQYKVYRKRQHSPFSPHSSFTFTSFSLPV